MEMWPTKPSTGAIRIAIRQDDSIAPVRYYWSSINFVWSGNIGPWTDPTSFGAGPLRDLANLWYVFYGTFPTNLALAYVSLTDASGVYRQTSTGFFSVHEPDQPRVVCNCIAVTMQSDNRSRNGSGRLMYSWLEDDFIADSKVTDFGRSQMIQMIENWKIDHTYGGVTFRAAVWSRQTGDLYPCTGGRVAGVVSYLRKRRIRPAKDFAPIAWPDIW